MSRKRKESGAPIASYVRRHRVGFFAFLLFALIFGVVLSLYQLPVEAVFYASLLCLVAGVLIFGVEQVLSNALKYTPKGTISIYLEPEQTLVIEDTGIGIAAEDLPRIFEKGFTGYNGRTDKKSTGIGLYLSRRILTKLSHTIVIESEPGKGTRVKIGLASAELEVE